MQLRKRSSELSRFEASAKGIRSSPEKMNVLVEWAPPKSQHDVKSFLRLASHYRKFIRGFTQVTKAFNRANQSNTQVQYGGMEEKSLLALKVAFSTALLLGWPQFHLQFIITIRAEVDVGAVLEKFQGNGLQPIEFASRKLQQDEVKCSANEREVLGIVWDIGQWKNCFLGSQSIVTQTYYSPLCHLPNQASSNSRVRKSPSIL